MVLAMGRGEKVPPNLSKWLPCIARFDQWAEMKLPGEVFPVPAGRLACNGFSQDAASVTHHGWDVHTINFVTVT